MRFSVEEVEVGPFLVDLTTGRILRDGTELGLRPQAFRVFKTLIQNRGQYVDHEHMIIEAWDGTVVSRHTVDVTLAELKKTLQEYGSWISHRPKLGYRLDVPKSDDLVRRGCGPAKVSKIPWKASRRLFWKTAPIFARTKGLPLLT